jgi:hypothetical protein
MAMALGGIWIEPWLNLSRAARFLKIAPKTLRLAAGLARSPPSILYPDDP